MGQVLRLNAIHRERIPMRVSKQVAEDELLKLVGHDPVSATELVESYHIRCTTSTVGRHLRSLCDKGELQRRWDGNERFGRYVYYRAGS